jgi:SAM-dependent methyltransferase
MFTETKAMGLKQSFRGILSSAKYYAKEANALRAKKVLTEIPQANILEENLQAFEIRDWRTHFSNQLSGKGLEIGPLHRPMVRHSGMEIDYIDRCSVKELREHYPELNDLPLVEPHIIGDAQTLDNIPDAEYDFVIAAHVIEHMKNPLAALEAWVRVTKNGGKVYLIVPDKRVIFDKHRVRTTLEHIILDYLKPSQERDYEHYLDYARFVHDKMGSDAIIEADRLIETDYSIHFHVFIPTDVINVLSWFNENVSKIEILEGPVMSPGSDEFHFMLKVIR